MHTTPASPAHAITRDDTRARRGENVVYVGMMLHVLGVIGVGVIAAGVMDGFGDQGFARVRWAVVALMEIAIVWSILAANRVVRILVIWSAAWSLLGGLAMLALARLPAAAEVAAQVPLLPLGLLTVAGATGALLATATPWAHAWFRARNAAR
jgi:hypothetical protein